MMSKPTLAPSLAVAAETDGLDIGEALGPEALLGVLGEIHREGERRGHPLTGNELKWLDIKLGQEVAMPMCANLFLTWAEYECWRKYAPEFNQLRND